MRGLLAGVALVLGVGAAGAAETSGCTKLADATFERYMRHEVTWTKRVELNKSLSYKPASASSSSSWRAWAKTEVAWQAPKFVTSNAQFGCYRFHATVDRFSVRPL